MDRSARPCNQRLVRVFLLLLAAVFITRIPTLHRSVLDWDESLYFLMADAWRQGHLPYTTIWDNKPVGIYAIFALFQALIPGILAIRLATIAFVSALAFAVFEITWNLTKRLEVAWFAAVALVIGSLSNDGLSANTELFMATFTAYAALAALTMESGVLVGVLLGCAFMVKYVAVFEAPVIALLLVSRTRRVSTLALAVAGAVMPLVIVMGLYGWEGQFPLWLQCAVLSNLRRVAVPLTAGALRYAWNIEVWRWGTLYAGGIAMIALALIRRGRAEVFLGCWLAAGCVGVAASKSFYDHYFLQLLPVLCVMLGVWLTRVGRAGPVFVLASLLLPILAAKTAYLDTTGPDVPRDIAAALPRHADIYVFNAQPIIYALTNSTPPTRYVLPSELNGPLLPRVAGVDPQAELARILAANPEFIIRTRAGTPLSAELNAVLAKNYVAWTEIGKTEIYQRK